MRVHDMIVDERHRAAELFAGLSADQLSAASLCAGWSMHDVAAHLTTFLRLGQVKLYAGILVLNVLTDPPPKDRRTRAATAP
jgi:hypothetical protein